MNKIKLSNTLDTFALVDEEDFDRLFIYNWLLNNYGYAIRYYKNGEGKRTVQFMHNDVLQLPPNSGVDHKDRSKLNNQKLNLKIKTSSQNNQNSFKAKTNTSGYIGVYFAKNQGKWRAAIRVCGIKKQLGCFTTPEEAALRYDEVAIKHHGADALTNKKLKEERLLNQC